MSRGDKLRNEFYCIAVYDINVKRVHKVHKLLKQYLSHKQNSVFVGELRKLEFKEIEGELDKLLDPSEDTVLFMTTRYASDIKTMTFGGQKDTDTIFF
ncbi:CRISPR-associated endonuclease Cas2 [Pontibacillus halophilus]|uniref:CRISPR-associated endonuclease Cas2 n=1 Tax=Pontibacillus halophilus TaxID=516704 RepID=UPI00047B8025|nr:CRISPR-associated endonuclease Cas2 [Pontibacillus halophilus]